MSGDRERWSRQGEHSPRSAEEAAALLMRSHLLAGGVVLDAATIAPPGQSGDARRNSRSPP